MDKLVYNIFFEVMLHYVIVDCNVFVKSKEEWSYKLDLGIVFARFLYKTDKHQQNCITFREKAFSISLSCILILFIMIRPSYFPCQIFNV